MSYNGYGYFDTSELTWGHGTRMYADDERVAAVEGAGWERVYADPAGHPFCLIAAIAGV